ncbi:MULTISPECIES: hypothetical protein [Rhodococcus]|jgi:hypothetical protein|uniref:hypothetical protein n=1 Tax=Rhodococcus sp. A14 TaxID=1194106 RepID=UPI0002A1C984|nr:putative transposase [Rhodococcus wratislaviensis IFP 2016]NHU46206.1 hypothetical protein [Rhodococcus sp. A14]
MDHISQIQALDRTTPTLSMRIGSGGKHTHDYARHRTFTLFSAPDITTGTVTELRSPRHHRQVSSSSSNTSPAPGRSESCIW